MTNPAADAVHPTVAEGKPFPDYHTAKQAALETFEKDYLTLLFALVSDNISEAARIAGVERGTLYRLMERHDFSAKIPL